MKQDILKNQRANGNTFKVPEHYFEDFTRQMMAKIPEEQPSKEEERSDIRITLFTRIKPYLYLAALFGGLFFGLQVFKYQSELMSNKTQSTAKEEPENKNTLDSQTSKEQYVDDVFNYTMIENDDVYNYLAEND